MVISSTEFGFAVLNLALVKGARIRFVLLSLLACLGCTERGVRLASTTITSTPRSVNDVEVRLISNLLVARPRGLLPVRAMECQLFMCPAVNGATRSTRLQV